jgi:hypothetical protein
MAKPSSQKKSAKTGAIAKSNRTKDGGVAVRRNGRPLSAAIRRQPCRVIGTLGYALHKIPGGRKTFIEYARIAALKNEYVACFVEVWDRLSGHEKVAIPLDQVCVESASITPGALLGAVAEAAFDWGADVSNLLAATCLPEVVEKSIQFAKRKDGIKDRLALMQHSAFVPMPKSSVNVNLRNFVAAQVGSGSGGGDNGRLPTFEESTMQLSEVIRATEDEKEDKQNG